MHQLAQLDRKYVWHPFTQMRDWARREPIVIASGKGAVLRDVKGRKFLDANSSIWTNLHGHRHAKINAALRRQLGKIAHSSALGFANEPASLLAKVLVESANPAWHSVFELSGKSLQQDHPPTRKSGASKPKLEKVFFSDDGSTALEVALKLAHEYTRRTRCQPSGQTVRPRFLSLNGAYHGDTIGAVSLGHIDLFHRAYRGMLFKTDKVMSPYCYRCRFNRAKPERADAREYRECHWECIGLVEKKFSAQKKKGNPYAAFVFEPLVQGAAGMIPQPGGWLRQVAEIARSHDALLIADEVLTGFGRTGFVAATGRSFISKAEQTSEAHHAGGPMDNLFGSHLEGVWPDFLCVAKGLTGGYLPMAATLTTRKVFDAFLGEYGELKTFFHGHSFTGNQLGAAASLASLEILQSGKSVRQRVHLQQQMHAELQTLWSLPQVGDIRQVGLLAGVELVKDWRTREPFALRERAGIRVCEAMARRGVLTRPIGDVIVLMPPYCTTRGQLRTMISVLGLAVGRVFGKKRDRLPRHY